MRKLFRKRTLWLVLGVVIPTILVNTALYTNNWLLAYPSIPFFIFGMYSFFKQADEDQDRILGIKEKGGKD